MQDLPDILTQQLEAGAQCLSWGQIDRQVVQTFGFYEAEYAALRKGVGILHQPWRGRLRLFGPDVRDFLHRLLTQDLRNMQAGESRRAFLLNEKGRILADLWVHHGECDTWLDMDAMDLTAVQKALESRLFTEEVSLDMPDSAHTSIALHGPESGRLLERTLSVPLAQLPGPGRHQVFAMGQAPVMVYPHAQVGAPGWHLWVPGTAASVLYHRLTQAVGGIAPGPVVSLSTSPSVAPEIPGRAIGWLAFNTARLEAGTPLFHIDFGPDCLPHETGLLSVTTSFAKGCYIGQEIVARMQNLGHPRRLLAKWHTHDDRLPIAGAAVHQCLAPQVANPQARPIAGDVIGAVTSSALSPLRGQVAVGLAMMRHGQHHPGTQVIMPAEGQWVVATLEKMPEASD